MKKSVFIAFLLIPFLTFSQQNSVLSSGDWYKIAVPETGVYKITYDDLASYGLAVDEIDPRNLSIYGNLAGMLPEDYNQTTYTDLREMAIQIVGEEDGVFQPGDYILFYGQGPVIWKFDAQSQVFHHQINYYSDETFYFLTIGETAGKRIEVQPNSELPVTRTIDEYTLLIYHEIELENLAKSGKIWLGEPFQENLSQTFTFDLSDYVIHPAKNYFKIAAGAHSSDTNYFDITVNNSFHAQLNMPKTASNSVYQTYRPASMNDVFTFDGGENLNVNIEYNKTNDSAQAWLDYLEFNLKIAPYFYGGQFGFRTTENIGQDSVSLFYFHLNPEDTFNFWNVTDPLNVGAMTVIVDGDENSFQIETPEMVEFFGFNENNLLSPEFAGQITNQNLHAATPPDFLIITYPEFQTQASQLADFHETEDGMSTGVFTTEQVYNEFSSGAQDISAIRNFIWYLNDLSGEENKPAYVLLYGDASYDYKNFTENNTNFVPTFESMESANEVNSFASDRFFGVKNMQEIEGRQIAIGRMPLTTTEQADQAFEKILNYSANASLGSWKNEMMFIGDDGDNALHEDQANILANIADTNDPVMNFTKSYLDFFELVETEAGPRYPEANAEIQEKVNQGTFYINYTGHGGKEQLAEERILDKNDLNNWSNSDKLSLWVIGSADVANYTNPEFTSLGEEIYLKENAGAISVLSTTGANYASANLDFNRKIIEKFSDVNLQENLHFGDLMPQITSSSNDSKWILLGDPALKIRFPEFNIATTKINDVAIEDFTDTIAPGSTLALQGEINTKIDGEPVFDFNGTVYLKVYAPPYPKSTLGNQGTPVQEFWVQDSILAIASASFLNSAFEIQVYLPANYYENYGNLKLSWYAENSETDANGFSNQLMFGGEPNAIAEQNEFFDNIKVYPTFFTGHLTVEIPELKSQTVDYRVYGTMGNIVYKRTSQNENQSSIELPGLAKGMYILNVSTNTGSRNFKLVKN